MIKANTPIQPIQGLGPIGQATSMGQPITAKRMLGGVSRYPNAIKKV